MNKAMDKVRQFIAKDLKLHVREHALLWVVDFPMYDWNEDEQRLEVLLLCTLSCLPAIFSFAPSMAIHLMLGKRHPTKITLNPKPCGKSQIPHICFTVTSFEAQRFIDKSLHRPPMDTTL